MSFTKMIEELKTRFTPEVRDNVRTIWKGVNIGILGLNSFLLMFFREQDNKGIKYVICSGAAAYVLVFFMETVIFHNSPQKLTVVRKTEKIFRLIYTAIYLTAIMIDIIEVSEQPNPDRIMAYYGAIFIWVALWGTKCLWIQSLYPKVLNLYQANEKQIIGFFRKFYDK